MSQALYRKWRPRQWEEVVGQEHVVQTLRNAVASGRVAHAYLFAGPRGTGKTTTARLLAKAVNCLAEDPSARPCNQCDHCRAVDAGNFMDLIEIDAASNTSVEDVRDLRDKINFRPSQGKYKVYIIDEVHMLSTAAFNALLKTLEEPPPHAIFILATTEVHKIPATVLSRCQRHEFRRIPVVEIVRQLQKLVDQEGMQVEPDALTLIARQATGAMRDAISLLDQLSSIGEKVTLPMAQMVLGTATSQVVVDLVAAVLSRDSAAGLSQIHRTLDAGTDPRQFARQVVDYLRNLLLSRMGNADQIDATLEMRNQMSQQAGQFSSTQQLLKTIRAFNAAATDTRSGWQPGLQLELAFAESIEVEPVAAPAAAVQPAAEPRVSRAAAPAMNPQPAPARPAPATPAAPPRPAVETPATTPEPRQQPSVSRQAAAEPLASPAPAEPAPAGAPSESETPGAITLQQVTQSWPKIVALMRKQSPKTQGLLNSCRPLGIKNGTLLLAFQTEVIKGKMEAGENLDLTRQVVSQVLGVELQVRCVVASGKKNSNLPADINVDSDGMVGTALRDLGGEVVEIQ